MKNSYLKNVVKNPFSWFIIIAMLTTVSCKQNTREQDRIPQQTEIDTTAEREIEPRAFIGDIQSIGKTGNNLSGEIAMRVEGDLMRFTVSAEGLAPDMMHMQYLLVSQTGEETQCPGSVEEVEKIGGNTGANEASRDTIRRIPLHMGPSTLNMNVDTYPRTNINGELQFSRVVSLDSLRNAVKNEYNMQDLDFSKFTFVIRGIPATGSKTTQVGNTSNNRNNPVGCAKLKETEVTD